MKLAAIDIGSNAIRFQLSMSLYHRSEVLLKKLEYIRFPLRLGHDVFNKGYITQGSINKFMKLMNAYKLMIELYEVDEYMLCATSAIRESKNGKELVKRVYDELGLAIQILTGREEAAMIDRSIIPYLSPEQAYLHIDVGGGSTELNLHANGKKVKSCSFKVGSVRTLEKYNSTDAWKEMKKWVKESVKNYYPKLTALGTGGNISKLLELAGKSPGEGISVKKIKEVKKFIEKHSPKQRVYTLQMNPDRADIIIPASYIYIKTMEWAKVSNIIAPNAGLKDGMMLAMMEKVLKK